MTPGTVFECTANSLLNSCFGVSVGFRRSVKPQIMIAAISAYFILQQLFIS